MRIESLKIQGFRGIENLYLEFEEGITTLVGENNTGKSSVGTALARVFQSGATKTSGLPADDYPYGVTGPFNIDVGVIFSQSEVWQLIGQYLAPLDTPTGRVTTITEFVRNQGNQVHLIFTQTGTQSKWGSLGFSDRKLLGETTDVESEPWINFVRSGPIPAWSSSTTLSAAIKGHAYELHTDITQIICQYLQGKYKLISEFRTRSTVSATGAIESMGGSETASVLLNLRVHRDKTERARYHQIVSVFTQFYPRFQVEAVAKSPGSTESEIQFLEVGRPNHLSLSQVSAGIQEMLTLITNLVGREGLLIFIENPESHLHPHSMRSLQSLLSRTAGQNQTIVVTHNPHFVDPRKPESLRRVWWTSSTGTRVTDPGSQLDEKMVAQCRTALRHVGDREMVFARAVILVEDESQREFIAGVVPTLGYDLDATGISVISFDGDPGHVPYRSFLDAFGIPYVALKDLPWGDPNRYPASKFFSLGAELEEFLDSSGLATLRQEVIKDVGKGSKRRVAGPMALRLGRDDIPQIFDDLIRTATIQVDPVASSSEIPC
jgi:predicted ATPase